VPIRPRKPSASAFCYAGRRRRWCDRTAQELLEAPSTSRCSWARTSGARLKRTGQLCGSAAAPLAPPAACGGTMEGVGAPRLGVHSIDCTGAHLRRVQRRLSSVLAGARAAQHALRRAVPVCRARCRGRLPYSAGARGRALLRFSALEHRPRWYLCASDCERAGTLPLRPGCAIGRCGRRPACQQLAPAGRYRCRRRAAPLAHRCCTHGTRAGARRGACGWRCTRYPAAATCACAHVLCQL
jgi:hypothetical protein